MVKNKKTKEDHNKSITLIDEAYLKLKEMIFRQNVIPGQRLIAKDSVPFRGFYVKPVDIDETVELFEVREALEVQSVQLAIKRMDSVDLKALEEVAEKHRNYMPPYYDRKKVALGTYFHIQG